MAESVVILQPDEYQTLKRDKDSLNDLFALLVPTAPQDRLRLVGETFQVCLDPNRAGEWGHLSWCFTETLRVLLHEVGADD